MPKTMTSPSAETIQEVRIQAGLTQRKAAELVWVSSRTWQAWEQGLRHMPPSTWKLFLILTDKRMKDCLKDWR